MVVVTHLGHHVKEILVPHLPQNIEEPGLVLTILDFRCVNYQVGHYIRHVTPLRLAPLILQRQQRRQSLVPMVLFLLDALMAGQADHRVLF